MAWFAPLYDPLMSLAERGTLGRWRAEVVGLAQGRVLELGAGTGLNLPHYGPRVTEIVAVEPDADMRARLLARASERTAPVQVSDAFAEALPFEDATFDTVVGTLVLCSVADLDAALSELVRVLKVGGSYLFVEHVGAPGPWAAAAQRAVEPVWRRCAGNCRLTRRPQDRLCGLGLTVTDLASANPSGMPPLLWPLVRGHAVRSPRADPVRTLV